MKQDQTDIISTIIGNEKKISDKVIIDAVPKILDDITSKQVEHIQTLLIEKERLDQNIKIQTDKLQELQQATFVNIETFLLQQYGDILPKHKEILTQLQLESIDLLDILLEITESAFIAAIENGENIEASFGEIARNLTYKTLKDGYLTLDRAKHVIKTMICVASDIAEVTPTLADDILKGSIYGTKKGVTQSIELFKEQFAYIPDQLAPKQIKNMKQTFKDLHNTKELFIDVIKTQANNSEPIIKEKINNILEHTRPDFSELVNVSKETLFVVSEKLTKISKQAVVNSEKVFHSKVAIQAKRLGTDVWDVAKSAISGAINSAKDIIEQKKKPKK